MRSLSTLTSCCCRSAKGRAAGTPPLTLRRPKARRLYGMRQRKYQAPTFLDGLHDQAAYERWLQRKAMAHVKRDKKRGNNSATVASYKEAIHLAVCESDGRDFYTGEELDWTLISTYNNEESKEHRREYKKKLALLPSVDHVDDGMGAANFKICAWRTNDCKNDLTHEELVRFCSLIIRHAPKAV